LYACPYDLAAGNEAPWCDVFHADELAAFEYDDDLGCCGRVTLTSVESRYEMDLLMDAIVGYQAPNNAGRVMGSVFVNKLIKRYVLTLVQDITHKQVARFEDESEEAQSLYLEFGHDFTILTAMAAMELNRYVYMLIVSELVSYIRCRDDPPLSPEGPPTLRKFRTSYQTPFAANMVWERFTCKES
jgi:hypothetical protein